jgi:hypothetical protein
LIIFQVLGSREEKERVAKGWEIWRLLVPSAKVRFCVVLTMMDWGEER